MKKVIVVFILFLFILSTISSIAVSNNSENDEFKHNSHKTYMTIYWYEQAKLLASDGTTDDIFGISVSIDSEYAIIGAYYDDNATGSAYIFKRNGTSWIQEDKLTASDGATGDYFGYRVSIDGDYALVGAPIDDNYMGSAYVFKRNGTSWIQEDKLTVSDGEIDKEFGWSVSLDGDYALIGAGRDYNYTGSAYIFKRNGTSWIQEDKLTASDGEPYDWFGDSVSLDGDYALIGARLDDDNGETSGSAYVFKRTGSSWMQQAKLTASDGAPWDWFGDSVSLDGDYALIGAHWDDDNGDESGSAYMFKRTGTSWIQEAKLTASDGAADDEFGYSTSIDGDYAFIGAPGDDNSTGSAYMFKRTGTSWIQEDKLIASDGAANDVFGCPVSTNGEYALIGAPGDDSNKGSAYVFKRNLLPDAPTITGETNGKAGVEYSYCIINATDPDGDDIWANFSWGDGSYSGWIGPKTSGEDICASHAWDRGNYEIKAKLKDEWGLESDWSDPLPITMPKNKIFIFNFPLLNWLFERFPNGFPVLRYILGL